MHGTGFQGIHHGELIHWGLGVSRVVVHSLRSAGARLNTSYFNTKEGCDVHTNEAIIGGFITQFLLSLIWQTYPLCSHHCCGFQVCASLRVCVCVCVNVWFWLACFCLIKRFSRSLVPQISSFQILQGYPTSLTLNHWKNTTLFISGVREESVAVKQDVVKCIYVIYLIYSVREGCIV